MTRTGAKRAGWTGPLLTGLLVVALGAVVAEAYALRRMGLEGAALRAQSERLRGAFALRDTVRTAHGTDVLIRLQNVRFTWSDKVYIDAGNMAVRAAPVQGTTVDFDDLESFSLNVQESVVLIRPNVLAGMFNESVFNYPGSRVSGLKVAVVRDDGGGWIVRLNGTLGLIAPVPFTLFTHLGVDAATNTLVIEVDRLKIFGILPVTKLIRWTPLTLDRLIALPPNRSLMVDRNRIMVKPFGLFPPPRISGRMAGVEVGENAIRLTFSGDALPAPRSTAKNYVFMRGGASQFGHFRMADTNVLILDQHPADPFVFSLLHYADMIPRSAVSLPDTRSVQLTMPDFQPLAAL